MRRSIALLAAGGLLAAVVVTPAAATAREGDRAAAARDALSIGAQVAKKTTKPGARPSGPNPYLALVPDPSAIDYAGWRQFMAAKAGQKALQRQQLRSGQIARLAPPLVVDEDEPAGVRGSNDSPATAQPVVGFGTAAGRNPRARLLGTLSPEEVTAEEVEPNAEDDGSIPLAGDTGIGTERDGITTSAEIGDGPHGSAGSGSGDFDFYLVHGVAGEELTVDIDTPVGELDSMVAVFDDTGAVVAFNDDADGFDSFLTYPFTADGEYTVMVTGFPVLPEDPFDSGSGTGAASEGPYNVAITMGETDVDFYAVRLRKGDVLGASVEGSAARLAIHDPSGADVHGSTQDATFIFPAETPLPGGGNAVTEHVADQTGWHYVAVANGAGDYDVTVEVYRPRLETDRPVQTIFLDFDGAAPEHQHLRRPRGADAEPAAGIPGPLGADQRQRERVDQRDHRRDQGEPAAGHDRKRAERRVRLQIRNSRDHGDPFGHPNVCRVIVGGTIEQSGVYTIGIAQSIDPGNFVTRRPRWCCSTCSASRPGSPRTCR